MFQWILFPVFLLLLNACTFPDPPRVTEAGINDLASMRDCREIMDNIKESQEILAHYQKSKRLDTMFSVASFFQLILLQPTSELYGNKKMDYYPSNTLDQGIESYKYRLEMLDDLRKYHCAP